MNSLNGILVINSFLRGEKTEEMVRFFLESGARNDVGISVIRSGDLMHNYEQLMSLSCDFVLFWDKDTILARMLEDLGHKVFNKSEAIADCDNKAQTYLRLGKRQIRMPKTVIAPLTFEGSGYNDWGFAEGAASFLGFPMVVKELYGSFGHQVYLAHDMDELRSVVSGLDHKGFLMQELIGSSYGKDLRINVVGGEVVSTMMRYSEKNDFRSNISNGGSMKRYDPDNAQREIAVRAFEALNLDFAGVDVLFGEDGPYICEVNSNPHFKSSIDCTGIDVSDHIIKHIKNKSMV